MVSAVLLGGITGATFNALFLVIISQIEASFWWFLIGYFIAVPRGVLEFLLGARASWIIYYQPKIPGTRLSIAEQRIVTALKVSIYITATAALHHCGIGSKLVLVPFLALQSILASDLGITLIVYLSSTPRGPVKEINQFLDALREIWAYWWVFWALLLDLVSFPVEKASAKLRTYLLRNTLLEIGSQDPYVYPFLAVPEHFRLLKVTGGFLGIHCELIPVNLAHSPPYDAISYTWGIHTQTHMLKLKDGLLPITENVNSVIQDLAPIFGTRHIWIDSICINQSDLDEKSDQVQLMRKIYKKANKVIIWLGDAPDAALARHWVRFLDQYLRRRALGHQDAQETMPFINQPAEWLALYKLLNHTYWTRVWIIQEILLGRKVELLYGRGVLDWEVFGPAMSSFFTEENGALAMSMNTYEGSEQLPLLGIGFISKLFYIRIRLRDGPLKLSELLVECSQSKASRPEDKVFALHGISNAAITGEMQPNYNMSFQEVFREIALYALREGSFSLFTMAGICSQKRKDLPTWVVDLEQPTRLYPLENALSTYRAGGADFNPDTIRPLNDKEIIIDGFTVDKVKVVAQIEAGFGIDLNDITAPGFNYDSSSPQIISHTIARHEEVYEMADQFLPDIYDKTQPPQPRREAVWRTIIGDEMPNPHADPTQLMRPWLRPAEESIGSDYINHRASLYEYQRAISRAALGDVPYVWIDEASNRVDYVTGRKIGARQFAITEEGYMALVPPGTQEGDCIAVFLGAGTPHVLRRVKGEREAYAVFGDAYVHGLMDGEALHLGVRKQGIILV